MHCPGLARTQRLPAEYYVSHPLVLGPGFSERDLRLDAVNALSYREAGIVVMGVNARVFVNKLRGARMLRTFRVKVGLFSDTGVGVRSAIFIVLSHSSCYANSAGFKAAQAELGQQRSIK